MVTRAIAFFLAVLLVGGCASPAPTPTTLASPAPSSASMTVSLGIYSGRPDPSWSLTEAQVAELNRLLNSLPTATGDPPQGGLGYHGFSVEVSEPGQAPRTYVAFRGAIPSVGSGPRTYWVDAQRTVEAYLLDTGVLHLTPNEIAAVEADLGMP